HLPAAQRRWKNGRAHHARARHCAVRDTQRPCARWTHQERRTHPATPGPHARNRRARAARNGVTMKTTTLRLWNITIVGLKAISRNKLRSFLTMLGIVIGVGCVIAVVAIGNGATKSVENTINSLGTNYIMIFPGAATSSGARMFTGNSTLTAEDADAIKQ